MTGSLSCVTERILLPDHGGQLICRHMNRFFIIFLLVFLVSLPALAETRLMAVSDLHYMAPSLYSGSELFLRVLRNGDGKAPQYGEELLAALYREIIAQQPDALIVTGDLTFNGEKKSHEALADWFGSVEAAGVPVWVIPGNHDINTSPVGFDQSSYFLTESVTPEEFASIYADFIGKGNVGFSYAVPVGSRLTAAMTDVSCYQEQAQTFGVFTAQHASWLESVLKGNTAVITATHHSLLQHTDFSKQSFLMFGHENMQALLETYGVRLNLSGHMHIQHVAREGSLFDAAQGAFCIWPHRYAAVTLRDDGCLMSEAKELNAAYLPDGFLDTSREWFAGIARDKATASGIAGTAIEKEAMADYAARFNLAYFSGTYRADDAAWTSDPAYALWEKQKDSLFWKYMRLVMAEANGENLMLTIGPQK